MQGDFSRDSFVATRGFSRVLSQQGRLVVDADWNELQAIQLHLLRALAADLIGPDGGTGFDVQAAGHNLEVSAGRYYVDGWLCENAMAALYQARGAGDPDKDAQPHLPVAAANDVLRLEPNAQYLVYLDVWERHLSVAETDGSIEVAHRTPPLLRDQAFGLVDTATRAQVVWQVRIDSLRNLPPVLLVLPNPATVAGHTTMRLQAVVLGGAVPAPPITWTSSNPTSAVVGTDGTVAALSPGSVTITATAGALTRAVPLTVTAAGPPTPTTPSAPLSPADRTSVLAALQWDAWRQRAQSDTRGLLRADARRPAGAVSTDPCTVSSSASYRGVENHLYRVEVHRGGTAGKATFKWSRDNGSIVFPVRSISGRAVTLREWWRDGQSGLAHNDLVEVLDDAATLRQEAWTLCRVVDSDPDTLTVTLDRAPNVTGNEPARHPILRRWDHQGGRTATDAQFGTLAGDLALTIDESDTDWIALEDGVRVQFTPSTSLFAHVYRTGDYWLVPARVAIADVVWPRDDTGAALTAAPHGVEHHYAPLAVVETDGASVPRRLFALRRPVGS